MNNLPVELVKLLYLRFTTLYGERFTRNYPTDELIRLWWEDWAEGLSGIHPMHIKQALSYCRMNVDWPPSLSEFRRYCERASGLPSIDETFTLAIRREFNHPIVKMVFDKVGSWAMSHDSESVLRKKIKEVYSQCLNDFRKDPKNFPHQLENNVLHLGKDYTRKYNDDSTTNTKSVGQIVHEIKGDLLSK